MPSSIYKGVYWDESRKKWRAHVRIAGVMHNLGYFKCEIDAALAYNRKMLELEDRKRERGDPR